MLSRLRMRSQVACRSANNINGGKEYAVDTGKTLVVLCISAFIRDLIFEFFCGLAYFKPKLFKSIPDFLGVISKLHKFLRRKFPLQMLKAVDHILCITLGDTRP